MSSYARAIAIWLPAAIVLSAAFAPSKVLSQNIDIRSRSIIGTWKGEYTCQSGRQKTRLELQVNEVRDGSKITAVFRFQTYQGEIASGSFGMGGRFEPMTGAAQLYPVAWIDQPRGYNMVSVEGQLIDNNSRFRGRINSSGCGDFTLVRSGVVEVPKIAAPADRRGTPVDTKPVPSPKVDLPVREAQSLSLSKNSPVEFDRKSVRVGNYEASYQIIADRQCSGTLKLRIWSATRSLFTGDDPQLRALASEIGSYLQERCPDRKDMPAYAYVGDDLVLNGELIREKTWMLHSALTSLKLASKHLDDLPAEISSLRKIHDFMENGKLLGGRGASDWQALRRRADAIAARIAEQSFASFRSSLASLAPTIEGFDQIKTTSGETLAAISESAPASLARYQAAVDARTKEIGRALVDALTVELANTPPDWRKAALQIALAEERGEEIGNRMPEARAVAQRATIRLQTAIDAALPAFRRDLEALPPAWPSLPSLAEIRSSLSSSAKHAPGLAAYIAAADERRAAVLGVLREDAVQEIARKGSAVADLEAVLDAGETLARQFTSNDAGPMADAVRAATAKRLDELARSGFPDFRGSLAAVPETRKSLNELRETFLEYAALELSIPAFADYRAALAARIEALGTTLCKRAQILAEIPASAAAYKLVLEDETTTLGEYVCAIDEAGKSISRFQTNGTSGVVQATYKGSDGQETVLELAPSPELGDDKALIGVAVTTGSERQPIARAEWLELAAHILEPAPSGIADRNGVTECDRVAADPDDPRKLAPGVPADKLAEDDRALEACVVALEHDPGNARLRYQLGRVLLAVGSDKEAKTFFEKAAADGHAAAHAALGDIAFLDEAAEKDALQHYQIAISEGYKAVSDKITALSAAVQQVDVTQDWPATGSVKLVCYMEVEALNDQFQTEYVDASEVKVLIDLDAKSVKFDDEIVAFQGVGLVSRNGAHKMTDREEKIEVDVARIGGWTDSPTASLQKNSLKFNHQQELYKKEFGEIITGRLYVKGDCLQDY